MSYFTIKIPLLDAECIISFPSYHKTNILGAIRTMTTTKRGKIKWKTLNELFMCNYAKLKNHMMKLAWQKRITSLVLRQKKIAMFGNVLTNE